MKRMMTFLWKGDDLPAFSAQKYDLRYVHNLCNGFERYGPDNGDAFEVMADNHYFYDLENAGFTPQTFNGYGVGGWSNVLEGFRPDLWPEGDDRIVLAGLDTVILRDISWLWDWDLSPVGLPLDPYHSPKPCDAVISFNREGAEIVWNAFLESRKNGMEDHLLFGRPSEMQLLRDLYFAHNWQPLELRPDRIRSYKVHGFAPEADIVYFHGKPKPHELREMDPVRQLWEQ